jgi:hypothetical protein
VEAAEQRHSSSSSSSSSRLVLLAVVCLKTYHQWLYPSLMSNSRC